MFIYKRCEHPCHFRDTEREVVDKQRPLAPVAPNMLVRAINRVKGELMLDKHLIHALFFADGL